MLQGTLTAMITPLDARGHVDFRRLARNVKWQVAQGIDGLVPVGTTGESPTLNHEEHRAVIERVVEVAGQGRRRVPVVAGTGSNATSEALDLTAHAAGVGADASLQVVPYYNKPTQEGLYRHFMTIADKVDLPMVLYNIPARCGAALTAQTIARLAKHPNVVGVKEATGSLDLATEILALCGPRFVVLSGDDSLTLPIMSVGGRGVVSVLSNLLPRRVAALTAAALEGDFAKAGRLHRELFPLCKAMFVETNPIPIKTAMMLAGMDSGVLRLPMCPMSELNRKALRQTLTRHRVL